MGYFPLSVTLFFMASIYSAEYQRFLRNLKMARLQAHLTQAEVALRLNKHQSYVSKCESGERRVVATELARFAKIYAKPLSFFIGDETNF